MGSHLGEAPGISREPYRSLQHLVWHISAILQSMDIMQGEAECRSLEDLVSRLQGVSALIEVNLSGCKVELWDMRQHKGRR
jgi:hypothetical protein